MEMNEFIINGKGLGAYAPVGNKSYSPEDIANFLKRFQLNEALRLIGEISHQRFLDQQGNRRLVGGVPVSDYVLAYLAMRLIESSNDYRKNLMTPNDLLKAADMYWGLVDPIEIEKGDTYTSVMVRVVYTQLDYQRPIDNLLPRSCAIYRDIWPQVSKAVEIQNALETISGLKIDEFLVMSFAFSMRASKGFFRLYPPELTTDKRIKDIFTVEKQEAFAKWVSCDYSEFRTLTKAELSRMPSSLYEKFRLNPLIKYPAVRTDRNPRPGQPTVYMVPIPRLLIERVTRGLYFELSDFFRGSGRENPFRTSFGYVFQEYVGVLLKDALGPSHILPELRYGKPSLDSTDWMVLQDGNCVLIEVKQSSLFLNAKSWGDIKAIQADLTKTVGKGVKQLWAFEQAMVGGGHEELKHLAELKEVERVVVTHDRSYFANSIIRQQVLGQFGEDSDPPKNYHWHLISIDELEELLGLRSVSLFELLKDKRLVPTDDAMDFGDYLGRKYADKYAPNAYLTRIKEEFFTRLNAGDS